MIKDPSNTIIKIKKIKKSDRVKKIKENISTTQNKNALFKNSSILWKSIKQNGIFWITSVVSVFVLTFYNSKNNSYINAYITFLIAMLLGWYIHYLSHAYDLLQIYKNADNTIINYIKSNKMLNQIMEILIYYTCDFHDKIHHDTSINKKPLNLLMEFFQNFLMEGGFLILFAQRYNFSINIKDFKFKLNKAVLLLWGLLYASVHNINYILLGCDQHTKHHTDTKTNYGIDTLDILFDTKYDINNIENINHAAINMIIITLIIWYYKIYM
jgi:hypothetical protein